MSLGRFPAVNRSWRRERRIFESALFAHSTPPCVATNIGNGHRAPNSGASPWYLDQSKTVMRKRDESSCYKETGPIYCF